MPSIIEGHNYDIFISYRQKDNKYDGWVTEFVDNLKKELEATFKEEISVYFDINPHDGLLETHDVDASLKDKLKCLVFIPIISRTYCDPKSFAWEHEFKAFVEQASQDQFGLKVKLPGGNVANRVLPIRIYDLNNTDIRLCEIVLGGVLRGVEFVYAESGVNRPLKPDDDEKINLNKTKYRNQINKVGNAIQEIISGLLTEPIELAKEKPLYREPSEEVKKEEREEEQEKPAKLSKRKLLTGSIVLAVLLVIAAILAYPKIFKRNILEKLRSSGERISVAVMPFQNMTNDTTWNVWQDGIQNNLITYLSDNPEELSVRQIESVKSLIQDKGHTNYASLTPSVASSISKKLDASVFIYGSINQAGSTLRLNARLIDSKTEETLKSFQIEGLSEEKYIFHIIDSLSVLVKNYLIISQLEKEVGKETTTNMYMKGFTNSPEAYRYYIYGMNAFVKERDFTTARNWYLKAIEKDSNFTSASYWLIGTFYNQGLYDQAKEICYKVYKKRDQMPMQQQIMLNDTYAVLFETPYGSIKWLRQLLEIDDQQPITYYLLGYRYMSIFQYEKAIPGFEKSFEIYKKWGIKNPWIYAYIQLGYTFHMTGQYNKEKELYKSAEQDFPDDPALIYNQAVLALTEGKTKDANDYIEKYKSISKENSISETAITTGLAGIYFGAGVLDEAEKYYRQALSLEQESPGRMNTLAYFLIDKDRNISEGLELVDKALKSDPDNYIYLHCKGWGLYKQGKYKEALEILQKSWDLRMKNAIYDHEAYLHLEAAKKAVAIQKNN